MKLLSVDLTQIKQGLMLAPRFVSKSLLLLIASLAPVHFANAAFSCSGQVGTLAISPGNGMISVDYGYGVHYLCSVQSALAGVDPQTCKSWYAMFLAAKVSKMPVTLTYDDTAGGATSCAALGSWVFPKPAPYFVNFN